MTQVACPRCGSSDARYLNVIHEAGLSNVNTSSRGAGCSPLTLLLFPLIGFWSLLFSSFGRARTTGTVQTVSSARAAPPGRKPVAFSVLMVLAGVFVLSSSTLLGLLLLVIGGLSLYAGVVYNRRVYPYQLQVWEQSAMCQRCGTVFVADDSRITLDAVTTRQVLGEQQRRLTVAAQPALTRAQALGAQAAQRAAQKAREVGASAQREISRAAASGDAAPDDTAPDDTAPTAPPTPAAADQEKGQ